MKQLIFVFIMCLMLTSCSKNDSDNNCNFLVNAGVDFTVNLNLPQFNDLQFPSNSVYVANQGNGGVFVTNTGSGILAWDAADPNLPFSNCSILTLIDGITAKNSCDDENTYELITGQSLNENLPCTLKPYRVEQTGNNTYLITN